MVKEFYLKYIFLGIVLFLVLNKSGYTQTYDVGNTDIKADVGALGNATATVPIYCPAGRLGIKPNVSLVFNSQANSGLLGKGWNLSGMSVISRSGSNWHLDNKVQETVNLNENDKLTLDGQRLLKVEGGTTGAFIANNNVFRTEVDQFVKVTYKEDGGNSYFIVDMKDGGKAFYGQANNSQHKPLGTTSVLAWYISKSYDRNGNYMEYFYDNTDGQILLTAIKYTGYDATINGTKTSSLAKEAPFNKVEFSYEATSHEGNQYIKGAKIVQNKRLHHVTTFADATQARTYWMNYDSDDINSYLTKITEQNGVGELMHPIDITWTPDATSDKTRIKKVIDSELFPNKYYGDFDGDGRTDILMVSGILNPLNGQLLNSPNFKIINYNGYEIKRGVIVGWNISSITVGDLNADGTDDLLLQKAYIVKSGADRPNFDICYDDFDRFKLDRIKYNYFLWDTKTASVIQSDLLNKEYIQSTDYTVTSPATPVGVPVINPNYNGYFTDEAQLWKFLHVEPVLVDMDGDGKLDVVLKEMWAKRVIGATSWCDDVERTEVTADDGYIINLSIYPSSLNLINKNYLSQKITLIGSGNRISNFVTLDFNGNGKTDFMIIYNNNKTSILEYNSTTNTLGHIYGNGSYSFPTTDYHKYLKTGDFNGDGKTDLLYFHMTQPYNINSVNNWYIAYSNGVGFNEYIASDIGVSHNLNPDDCVQAYVNKIGIVLDVGDFNGDGKSDIIERHHHEYARGHIGNSIFIYYSKGLGFKETQVSGSHDSPLPVIGSTSNSQYYDLERIISADFDGDGKCDQLLYSREDYLGWTDNFNNGTPPTKVIALLIESFKSMNFKLTKLSYSDKHNVDFEYSLLNNGYRKNYPILGKCLVITAPIYVVNAMTTSIIGLNSKKYQYSYGNLLLNKHGRGILGFTTLTVIDEMTNGVVNINKKTVVNEYKQNDEFLYKLDLANTSTYLLPNGSFPSASNQLSKTEYTNKSIKTTALNNNINFFYTSYLVEYNYMNGLKKATCFEYDTDGNLIHTQETYDKINNTTGTPEYTNTSDYKYEQKNSWLPSSLTIRRNCQIRDNGTTPYYVQNEMSYYANGNLSSSEYFKNNLSYYYKEITNYDKYGNISNTSLDSANNASTTTFRTKYFTYTNGRFLQKVKNALNQETTYTYEPIYGNKTQETTAGGLTTNYEYDNWGKLTKTILPSGNYENIVFTWATSNTQNIYYYVTKTNNLGNMSWEYYNALDQKVRAKTKGFNGQMATQSWTYNSDNMLIGETNLYDATDVNNKRETVHEYDIYKRPFKTWYNGVLMATYGYVWGTTTSTVTDGKNRTKSTTMNATGLIEKAEDRGGKILYKYGSHNKLLETVTNGTTITLDYNVQLNKISMTDPNTGTILYDYNAFGELIGQKDAKQNIYYYKYDDLGRLIQKWGGDDVYKYNYYATVGDASLNQIQSEEFKIQSTIKHKKSYSYNTQGLLSSVIETAANGNYYTTTYDYNANEQCTTVTYPNIALNYVYDNFNNLKQIMRNGTAIWTKNSEDMDGKITSESYGNGFTTTYGYDTHRQLNEINSVHGTNSQVALKANYQFELETGNLLNRQYNDITYEGFTYDDLDRLKIISQTPNSYDNDIKTYDYEPNGNIKTVYNNGWHNLKYESSKPNALTTHEFENSVYDMPGSSILKHNYTYTAFDKIASIDQDGPSAMNITYGVDQQRIKMEVTEGGSLTIDKYYIGSANMEITNGNEYTYLYAEGKPFAIYKSNTEELFYLHLDYQGSLMAISNLSEDVIERRSYDAWGRPREPYTWSYDLGAAFGGAGYGITIRGYTMHEHLEMFSLINMNGRLYDPVLGRMLSPDNYIQAPNNTQSYNRYSYCVNNPLKYTDPSGNIWGQVLAGLGGAYLGGVVANGGELNPTKWNYSNPGTYLGIGLGAFGGYMYTPGTIFNFSASFSGITLPLARYIVGQGIHFGFEEKYFGGKLGGGFAFKHNKKNSGGDLTMNDDFRTLVQAKVSSPNLDESWGDVYASIENEINYTNKYWGIMSIVATTEDENSITGGHAWIELTQFGHQKMTMSIWSEDGNEFFYNRELGKKLYDVSATRTTLITPLQFTFITIYLSNSSNKDWSIWNTCAGFSAGIWNFTTGEKLNSIESGNGYIATPRELIKSINYYNKKP